MLLHHHLLHSEDERREHMTQSRITNQCAGLTYSCLSWGGLSSRPGLEVAPAQIQRGAWWGEGRRDRGVSWARHLRPQEHPRPAGAEALGPSLAQTLPLLLQLFWDTSAGSLS